MSVYISHGKNTRTDKNTSPNTNPLGPNAQDGGSMTAIGQIDEIIVMLASMLRKMRNVMQDYNIKQQALGFNIQMAGYKAKCDGINKAYDASMASANWQIAGGVLGLVGALGAAGFEFKGLGAAANVMSGAGSACSHVGPAIGIYTSATETNDADMDKVHGEFVDQNAHSYMKIANDLGDQARNISEQMRSMVKDLVDIHARLTSAVRN